MIKKLLALMICFFMITPLVSQAAEQNVMGSSSSSAATKKAPAEEPAKTLTATEFAAKLSCGINLGNSLDVAHMLQYNPNMSLAEYEKSWGNPLIAKAQFTAIQSAGFQTVRIPVSWDEHLEADGTIKADFLNRVQEVVDMALESGLYVIIDTHHEDWLNLDLSKKVDITKRLAVVWKQIAVRFQEYDERLIFEGLNEPRLQNSSHEWTGGTAELQAFVNELNQTFVTTVRSAGGKNAQRFLMVCPYCHRVEEDALAALKLPDDDRLIVAVHLYQPSNFCLDTNSSKSWGADKTELQNLEQKFALLHNYFVSKEIPVVITEFGCVNKENTQDRIRWTQDFVKYCRQFGVSYLWWDNGGDFQLLNRENGTWVYPEIVKALTK
ncbi:MAG: glycoside hydrolase family 5 protein [Lachnospiraceae bacterium]|nr:glycoside hydrolase family 5 protein [Lachnospiraceae bacterium]